MGASLCFFKVKKFQRPGMGVTESPGANSGIQRLPRFRLMAGYQGEIRQALGLFSYGMTARHDCDRASTADGGYEHTIGEASTGMGFRFLREFRLIL
jgi:hypothetical protein